MDRSSSNQNSLHIINAASACLLANRILPRQHLTLCSLCSHFDENCHLWIPSCLVLLMSQVLFELHSFPFWYHQVDLVPLLRAPSVFESIGLPRCLLLALLCLAGGDTSQATPSGACRFHPIFDLYNNWFIFCLSGQPCGSSWRLPVGRKEKKRVLCLVFKGLFRATNCRIRILRREQNAWIHIQI